MQFKLGKKAASHDDRDIRFARVAAGVTLPIPPARFGHGTLFHSTGWGTLGNDRYGDCVFAGGAHEVMLTNKLAGRTVTFDDAPRPRRLRRRHRIHPRRPGDRSRNRRP
jgi:hypothetical protein